MGAFEFVESAESDVDLTVADVGGPADATTGDWVTASWTARNVGSGLASGAWHNVIAILPADGDEDREAVAAEVVTEAVLGPGGARTFQAQARVPGGMEGAWRWRVRVNSRGELFEGRHWTNNTSESAATFALAVSALAVDGAPVAGSFAHTGEAHWFRFAPDADADVQVELDLLDDNGETEVFVGYGRMPTRLSYDARSTRRAADRAALIAGAPNRACYVLAYPRRVTGGAADFRIGALEYRNRGATDLPAPVLELRAERGLIAPPGAAEPTEPVLRLMGLNGEGPAGVLPPGAGGRFELAFQPDFNGAGEVGFQVRVLDRPLDVSSAAGDAARPPWLREGCRRARRLE